MQTRSICIINYLKVVPTSVAADKLIVQTRVGPESSLHLPPLAGQGADTPGTAADVRAGVYGT